MGLRALRGVDATFGSLELPVPFRRRVGFAGGSSVRAGWGSTCAAVTVGVPRGLVLVSGSRSRPDGRDLSRVDEDLAVDHGRQEDRRADRGVLEIGLGVVDGWCIAQRAIRGRAASRDEGQSSNPTGHGPTVGAGTRGVCGEE